MSAFFFQIFFFCICISKQPRGLLVWCNSRIKSKVKCTFALVTITLIPEKLAKKRAWVRKKIISECFKCFRLVITFGNRQKAHQGLLTLCSLNATQKCDRWASAGNHTKDFPFFATLYFAFSWSSPHSYYWIISRTWRSPGKTYCIKKLSLTVFSWGLNLAAI